MTEEQKPCPECRGSGTVVEMMMSEFPVPITCNACSGTGRIEQEDE